MRAFVSLLDDKDSTAAAHRTAGERQAAVDAAVAAVNANAAPPNAARAADLMDTLTRTAADLRRQVGAGASELEEAPPRGGRGAPQRATSSSSSLLARTPVAPPPPTSGAVSYTHLTLPTNREV